jgi:hypothetical protein
MAYTRGFVLNYLIEQGIEIVEREISNDRIIDFINPINGKTAYLVIDFNDDYVNWLSITRICSSLVVKSPLP